MPSTTRGSILISTANDIGEALVEKLGGVGYSPNEWKEKYNLCGIAPVDSAPALSVLSDSAGTGDERGSILIATADAIGAILNKKYNVLRGFKPKEWASACRKMKTLEEGSAASSSIASFSDGADTVPLTSCVCNIDANLDGKSAVVCTKTGKNLVDDNMYQDGANRVILAENVYLKSGTYTISLDIETPRNFYYKIHDGGSWTNIGGYNKKVVTFTISEDNNYDFSYYVSTGVLVSEISNLMLEVGSSATTFEPYKTPETKTADLGRVIYGGSADIITGEGTDGYIKYVIDGVNVYGYLTASNYMNIMPYGLNIDGTISKWLCDEIEANSTNFGYNSSQGFIFIRQAGWSSLSGVTDEATFNAYCQQHPITLILPLVTPENFTFEPVKIDSFPGVNNIWNDCGNTAVGYYQAPTPYTRKTATGGIANFSDQRTDLPLTKAIANIAPSIAGKSAVNLVRAGNNLFDKTKATIGKYINVNGQEATNEAKAHSELLPLKPSTSYYMSGHADASYYSILALDKDMNVLSTWYGGASKTEAFVATTPNNARWCYLNFNADQIDTMIFAESATAISYEPYNGTTYTAELGETVYGGSVDFVSGEVKKTHEKYSVTGQETGDFLAGTNNNGNRIGFRVSGAQTPLYSCGISNIGENKACLASSTWTVGSWCIYTDNKLYFVVPNEYTTFASALQYLVDSQATFVFPLATPIESEIPGRVISPIEGVNNYWNDAGGDTEIQYFENET